MVLGGRIDWTWVGLKAAAHALALWPFATMVHGALNDGLGADPVAALTHATGDWALRLLLLSLAMTPLRRLTGQPWPIRFRRLVGLYAVARNINETTYQLLCVNRVFFTYQDGPPPIPEPVSP